MLASLRRHCAAALLLVAAFVAAAAEGAAPGVEKLAPPAWIAPLPPLPAAQEPAYRNSPLAHIAHDTQILARGAATERYEHHAYRINQPAALNGAGTVTIPYSAAFQSAGVHFLRIRREDKVIDLSGTAEFRVFNQESRFNQGMLLGNGTAVAQVPDLRVGDVLEYAYTIKGNNPVFGDRAAFNLPWNSLLPVAMRRLRVIDPAGNSPGLRVISPRGAEALEVRRLDTAHGREVIVEGRNLPLARVEPNMPAGLDPFIMIAITPFASWQEVSRWADGLFRAEATPAPAWLELLGRLKKMPRQAAVAEAVRFVQDDIRYFSLSIGENSHRPYAPSEVLARRYGDCKDKSLLLASLLRGLGVDARPALVSSTRKGGIARFPPTPNVFDHVVTHFRFEGRDYWIDPTRASAGAAFDRQGIAFAGARALRVGSNETALTDIPDDGAFGIDVVETADVRALDAPVGLRVESRLTGAAARAIRDLDARRGKDASERAYLEDMSRRYTDVKAAVPPQAHDEGGVLMVTERYEIGQFFRAEGLDKKLAPLGAHQLLLWLGGNGQRERTYPFAIPGGRGTFRYAATVNFPTAVTGREDPISNTVADEHFRLTTSRSFRGNAMRFSAELAILKSEVAPTDFAAYLAKVKQAREALIDFVLITPENLTAGTTAPRRVAERMKDENRALTDGLTKAIDSGNLADSDAAEAYARRAVARTVLRDDKGAMDDLNASLRLKPFQGQALSDRGLIHMRGNRLSTAEEDLTRAVTLGAEATTAYLRRGFVRFLGGRHAEALADFQQAERANALGINRDFIVIWQALALRALGRDPKPALAAGLAGDRRRWPVPVMALIAGEATAADVLRAAESRSADERNQNLCEARFFIGQHQFLNGDRHAAAESFRAALATGVDWFQEYDLAQISLVRLKEGTGR